MTIDRIKEILANQLSKPVETIKDETVIATDLGADSLDLVEVIMTLEDEYGVSIPDEEIPNIKTVQDLANYIDNNKK